MPSRPDSTFFILLLMLLVGTVFVKGPAMLLVELLPAQTVGSWFGPAAASWLSSSLFGLSAWLWLVMLAIYAYYVLATLLLGHRLRFWPSGRASSTTGASGSTSARDLRTASFEISVLEM